MSYPSYHHGGRYPADEHPPPWAMGAGYHAPDGGDYCHYGEPGEFHVGSGLSQRVVDNRGKPHWVTRNKAGKQVVLPFNEDRYKKAKAKGRTFRVYTGKFNEKPGHNFFVPREAPNQMYTYAARPRYNDETGKGHPKNQDRQRRHNPQKRSQNKKKKSKNGKVDSALINLIKAFKSHADEPKSKGSPFPNLSSFQNPSLAEFETAFGAFKVSFDNSENDFVGRNMVKTWPKDLVGWKFPEAVEDLNANYKQFYQHASKLIRGVAQLLTSTRNYKKSVYESNILAKAIAKANGIDEEITMEQLKSIFSKKYEIALHSEQHIFAMLPSRLDGIVDATYTVDTLVAKLTEKKIVDIKTMGILSNNNFKILKQVLKRAKKHEKKVSQPRAPTAQPNESQFRIGSHGLVGMSSAHVY